MCQDGGNGEVPNAFDRKIKDKDMSIFLGESGSLELGTPEVWVSIASLITWSNLLMIYLIANIQDMHLTMPHDECLE